jgi:hypothetical protein
MFPDPLMVAHENTRPYEVVSKDMQTVLWVRYLLGRTDRPSPLQVLAARFVRIVSQSRQVVRPVQRRFEEAVP